MGGNACCGRVVGKESGAHALFKSCMRQEKAPQAKSVRDQRRGRVRGCDGDMGKPGRRRGRCRQEGKVRWRYMGVQWTGTAARRRTELGTGRD